MSYQPIPLDSNNHVASATYGIYSTVDPGNSTTTPLLANATFTGSTMEALAYAQLSVFVFSDVDSAIDGLKIQQSTDGINWDHSHSLSITGNVNADQQAGIHARYVRIVYTNGPVNQTTFRLQTLLRVMPSSGSILESNAAVRDAGDALLTKSIITGKNSLTGVDYIDVKSTPDGGLIINQNIQVDPTNSSTANLTAGSTYIGATASNITATVIQVFLKTDQNCLVHVDQSQDGVNWDISDSYNYYASIGNFGININAFGTYYRVRVQNIGSATTTYFRLQTITVPVYNTLPRSLSQDGWLQTTVNHVQDSNGYELLYTPSGTGTSISPFRLVGGSYSYNTLDSNFWTANVGTGGTAGVTNGELVLTTGTTANNAANVASVYSAKFIGGTSNKLHALVRFPDAGTATNNTRRIGTYFGNSGPTLGAGAFVQHSNGVFALGTRLNGVDTLITNGNLNGRLGSTFTITSNLIELYIIYQPDYVAWFVDDVLLHSQPFLTTPWSQTHHFPIFAENYNTNGSTANVALNVRHASVFRLGSADTQAVGKYQSGTTAGITYKIGAGSLLGIIISNITNTANVTLYDSTTAAGTILWSSGALSARAIPISLDFKGIAFSNGLTITITGAACNTLVTFE